MANENIKIMNWKNGLLLSTVSYMLYLILWFILDDETAGQLPEMAIADYIIDYLLCMLFTYISLGFSFLVFRVLPFRTSYVWVIVYASCLFTLNNVVAFGMISLFNFLWGENGNGLLDELLEHERRIYFCHDFHILVKRLCQHVLSSVLHQGTQRETGT